MVLTCYQVLKQMELRPGLYVGEEKLKNIQIFLVGYTQALHDNNIKKDWLEEASFHDWVQKKLGYYESTPGWANMITAHCMGYDARNLNWNKFLADSPSREQHQASIKLFYKFLEEFRTEVKLNLK